LIELVARLARSVIRGRRCNLFRLFNVARLILDDASLYPATGHRKGRTNAVAGSDIEVLYR
jgi:hypothetical protein